jgi:6-phosphogluconate dehydrogenase
MSADAVARPIEQGATCSALYGRFSSRGNATVADKIASAMRYGFGGHREKPPAGKAG